MNCSDARTSASSAVIRFNYSTWPGVAASWESKHAWQHWTDHLAGTDPAGQARLITTAKDIVRVPAAKRAAIEFLEVEIRWADPAAFVDLLGAVVGARNPNAN